MSKYHPLDVRHPSNRDHERRSYLLEPLDLSLPPAIRPPAAAESRRQASRATPARTSSAAPRPARTDAPADPTPASAPATPWGRPARPPATPDQPPGAPVQRQPAPVIERAGSGFAGFVRSLFFVAILVALVATQTDLLDPVLTEIRYRALDFGIRLPF